MTNQLRRSISSGDGSAQNMPLGMAQAHDPTTVEVADAPARQPDLALDRQALQILDSSDDCIKVLDLDGRILFMSRGGQVLLGIEDIKPFLNTSWIEFWQGEDRQTASEAIARARAGEVCTFQGYCPTPSRQPKWWECKVSSIRGIDGQVERLLCISRDITERKQIEDERKQAEEKLRESEERYRAIINQAVTGVACTDLDGNLTLVNQKYCDITGYCADELRQRRMQDITHPDDLPRNAELFHRMRTEGTPFEIEKRYIRKDGSLVWVNNSVSAIRDRDGKPQSAVAIVLDITERKQAQLNAEFLAAVTQALAEATCVEDIIQTVGEQLHRYLQVSNCAFVEINESKEVAAIHHSWHLKKVPSLVGAYQLAEFVTDEFLQTAQAGRTIVIRDVTTDPRIADPKRFARLKIGSFINVPLIRDREWKFTLNIYHQTPYNWRSDEIELMRQLANRIWTKLERTRIEIALRQNQELFSALVGNAPFGVYMIDAEFRFRQANQTAVKAFNIQPLIGRDLDEALRIIWQEPFATEAINRFHHTLATGEPFYSPPIVEPRADIAEIQSYDWQLHRITLPDGSYGVVCYFYDLSEIKRAEEIVRRNGDRDAFLVTLNDALRPLTDALEILATANRVLGERLGANRVTYFEVRGTEYVLEEDYVNGAESLRGSYPTASFGAALLATYRRGHTATSSDVMTDPNLSAAQRSAYADAQIAAYIGVPLVKQGEFLAGLAVHSANPRNWTSEEIALTEAVAERTWAAVERARAEAALRASEAKYRGLFESLDEGYFLADVLFDEDDQPIDIFYVEANPAATRMVGQDFTGRRLREIDPNYEAYWYEIFGRVAQTGVGERLEQYAEPDRKWYDFYVFKVGDGNSRRVSVVFKDITNRKRREAHAAFLAEIGEDFARLSTANEIMQTVGAKMGAYLGITTCNFTDVDEAHDRVTVHHGWSSPEVPSTVGTFRTSQYLSKEFERASRAGETVVIRNTQTDPRTDAAGYAALNMHSFVTVPFHHHGRWTHYIAICHSQPRDWREDEIQLIEEISNRIFPRLERARTEEALRESEAKYRSLFDSIDEGFCIIEVLFDATGNAFDYRFLEANAALEKQTGLVDVVGKTMRELAPQLETHWYEIYGEVALTGIPKRFESAAEGLGRFYDVYAFRMGEPHERKVAVLFNDISDRKQAEVERERLLQREQAAREEAERANRIKDEFLAVLSHELRSPLNPILGWSKLLQSGKLDETRTAQALATIERNAKLQSELIEDLLDVSRILRGKLSLNVAPVNLASTIRAAMETVRLAAEAKSIEIATNFAADVGLVLGDSTRLQQVIWNLLSNAVKFTPPGGQVNIRLERSGSFAQITVSDTGQGIAPNFLPYVFDYFRQADATTTRKFGGLGLGLAIGRHLVELHGGSVSVASPGEGQGATFTVWVPLMSLSEPANQAERSSGHSLNLNGIKILIVDDEIDTRELVAFVLEQQGAQVITATSAPEALLLLPQAKPDILLSDIGMPEMDGYMLIRQVRTLAPEEGGRIPAIALTAYAGDTNQQQVLAAGFQKHISKPIEPEELVQAIAHLVHQQAEMGKS